MTFSVPVAALGGALLAAAVVAFAVRPAALRVQPGSEAALTRGPEPAAPPAPVHVRPRTLVYVAGSVARPGVYAVSEDARVRDALAQAGGATGDADLVAVNLAAHVADGDEIAVPRHGEVPAVAPRRTHARVRGTAIRRRHRPRRAVAATEPSAEAVAAMTAAAPVDLNSATAEALADLPGLGPVLAERIVEFRTLNGPFASVDGLADVAGITPQRLDELEPLLTTR